MTRIVLLATAFVAISIAVIALRPAATPGPPARDFEAYWAAGRTFNDRADAFGRSIWKAERSIGGVDSRRDEVLPFIGPPHTLLGWSLAARLPYEAAVRLWLCILGVASLALVGTVMYASGAPPNASSFLAAVLLAIAFAPLSSDLALGQLALVAFLGATFVSALADRWWVAAACAACVAFAQPNASLGLFSQLGRNRATLAIAVGAFTTYMLGALAAGWAWPLSYARAVSAHRLAEQFTAIQFDPASLASALGAPPDASRAISLIVAGLAIAAAIALIARVRDSFARFGACSALTPFVAGFFHEHDFIVAFAATLWCALRTNGTPRAIALAGTLLVGIDWLGLAQRPTGIAQCALLAVAACAAFLALGDRIERRRTIRIMMLVGALFAGAATFAVHYPVPVWPDALGNLHVPPTATISAVWFEEQRASGLFSIVPAWSALRSLSLLGCALLAYAIYRHSSYCRTA
ncbi:MAG: DUF2029 domain-containing protein [Candidatus Eremiobacteraeota bacterium]|nr:DUF2029 domain-containing protein [Candidatus Eremiobacteraeota bacterium]